MAKCEVTDHDRNYFHVTVAVPFPLYGGRGYFSVNIFLNISLDLVSLLASLTLKSEVVGKVLLDLLAYCCIEYGSLSRFSSFSSKVCFL